MSAHSVVAWRLQLSLYSFQNATHVDQANLHAGHFVSSARDFGIVMVCLKYGYLQNASREHTMSTATPALSDAGQVDAPTTNRKQVVAICLMIAAFVSAVNLLARPIPALDHEVFEQVAGSRNAIWTFSLVGGLAIGLTYVLAGIAVCLLVSRRGATLATSAGLLLGIGGVAFASGFFSSGVMGWMTTGASPDDTTFFDYFWDHSARAFGPQLAGFLLAFVGFVLTGIALWRSRAVPRWLSAAVPATLVLTFLAGAGIVYDVLHAIFMGTLVVLAWHLLMQNRQQRSDA